MLYFREYQTRTYDALKLNDLFIPIDQKGASKLITLFKYKYDEEDNFMIDNMLEVSIEQYGNFYERAEIMYDGIKCLYIVYYDNIIKIKFF